MIRIAVGTQDWPPCTALAAFPAGSLPALMAAFLLGFVAVACDAPVEQRVPSVLEGRWVSDHPDYAGRFFEITSSSVTIGPGVEPPITHTILDVEETRDDEGRRLITLTYRSADGGAVRFPLTYDPESDTVWPRHQPRVVWRRTEPRR